MSAEKVLIFRDQRLNDTPQCNVCGAPLSADAPSGLCPRCLLELARAPLVPETLAAPSAGPDDIESASFQRFFGDYELIEEIARGGMGVVFRARQVSLNRPVAIKMILDGPLAPRGFVARFQTEAETVAKLQHPNIVPIYETGCHQHRHFFSMKLLEGGTLADRLARPIPANLPALRASVGLIIDVCRAVHYAHQHGVLHRDIKPANILFDSDGTAFVADFGLARLVETDSGLTQTGAFLGTPAYMAPEQAGEKQATTATDIYGLGAILFHLLTGRPPFHGPTIVETLRLVVEQEPPPPRSLNPALDRDLETICLKALAKDPAARYTSARAMAEDLDRWQNGRTILARPARPAEKFWRWCRRRPLTAALLACVVALLVAVAGISISAFIRINDALRAAEAAKSGETRKLWDSYLAQARAQRWSGGSGRRFDSLKAIASAVAIRPSLELRNEAIASLALDDLGPGARAPRTSDPREKLLIDWPRNRYAFAGVDGAISVRRLDNDVQMFALPSVGVGVRGWRSFSPDGRLLGVGYNDSSARYWNLETRRVVLELKTAGDSDFSPDSLHTAAAIAPNEIAVCDLDGSGAQRTIRLSNESDRLWWSPDGKSLALIADQDVTVIDLTGAVKTRFHLPSHVYSLAWHPASLMLVAGCDNQKIYPLKTDSSEVLPPLSGSLGAITGLAFHPHGNLLVSDSWDGELRLWDFFNGRQILAVDAGPEDLVFSPDGSRLAVYSGDRANVQLFDFASNEANISLTWPNQTFPPFCGDSLLFAADGGWLIARMDSDLRLWEPQTGRLLARDANRASGSLCLIDHGRAVFGWDQDSLCRISVAQTNGGIDFALAPFNPVIPPAFQKECPPGFFDHLGTNLSIGRAGASADGRIAAVVYREHCYVFDTDRCALQAITGEQDWMKYTAVSPDGKWVATGGWHNPDVRVWDAVTGQLIRTLPTTAVSPNVLFSPDGQFLVTSTGPEVRFWHCGDWTPGLRIARHVSGDLPSPLCFSNDGKLLALADTSSLVHLVSPQTGETLAQLEPFPRNEIIAMTFNPGASQLAINRVGAPTQIWNLRRIRQHLAQMRLDW